MAKPKQSIAKTHDYQRAKTKRTSIGCSPNTYPKNKKAQFKKYRGQGR